jgi:signal transduction histidine kinase
MDPHKHDKFQPIIPSLLPATQRWQGALERIVNRFRSKSKIVPEKSDNQRDITNDFTTYIRCIFHDFRGPLNNISLGTEILLNTMNDSAEEYSIAKSIKESCQFMSESLDGFLNVDNLHNSQIQDLQLNYQPFNIVGLVKKIQYILLSHIVEKKIDLKYTIQPLSEWVLGDDKHIQHVLMNLLSNAIKFSAVQSKIEIKLEGRPFDNSKQHVLISIIDSNPFISPVVKSQLFEKYNTSNSEVGMGLGLYICKKIIETHGGIIQHFNNSKKNTKGNIFRVELFLETCAGSSNQVTSVKNDRLRGSIQKDPFPKIEVMDNMIKTDDKRVSDKRVSDKRVSDKRVSDKRESDKRESDKKNTRMFVFTGSCDGKSNNRTNIMVIDDSEVSRKFMTKMIQQAYPEYKIYEATDGLDALIKMISFNEAGKKISMLLVDNVMPNLNGELLCKILRGMGYQGIIIGITGNGMQVDIDQYLENGADHVFIKPFTKDKMTALVQFVQREGYNSRSDKIILDNNGVLEWA